VLRIFIALAGFEPATFGSSGKHTNHYTTKETLPVDGDRLQSPKRRVLIKLRRSIMSTKFHFNDAPSSETTRFFIFLTPV
jgi:hypothetical protein